SSEVCHEASLRCSNGGRARRIAGLGTILAQYAATLAGARAGFFARRLWRPETIRNRPRPAGSVRPAAAAELAKGVTGPFPSTRQPEESKNREQRQARPPNASPLPPPARIPPQPRCPRRGLRHRLGAAQR